jgi:hypothetical protein
LRFNALGAARMQPTTSPTLYRSRTVSERQNARLGKTGT